MDRIAELASIIGQSLPNVTRHKREDVTRLMLQALVRNGWRLGDGPSRSSEPVMEMLVIRPSADTAGSIHLNNLVRASLAPRLFREGLAVGGAASAIMLGAAHFLAFLAAVSTLAYRSVQRPQAMTLHLAWKIARADRTFTFADMIAHAEQLREDYDVVKVAPTDIEAYLNDLERAGSLQATPTGYRLVETVRLLPF